MIIEAILLSTFIIHVEMFQVKGKITFEGGKPSAFPSNTWITIKVQDTSLADASAVNLAKQRNEITNYNSTQDLQFLIDDVKSPGDVGAPGVDITVSNKFYIPATDSTIYACLKAVFCVYNWYKVNV